MLAFIGSFSHLSHTPINKKASLPCSIIFWPLRTQPLVPFRPLNSDRINSLVLPFGKSLTREKFCNDPLIATAQGKNEAFHQLITIFQDAENCHKYKKFVVSKDFTSFSSYFLQDPIRMAIYAFAAYFEGKFDREELFITNIVAEAFKEKSVPAQLIEPSLVMLTAENVAKYLQEANFPLFAKERMRNGKSTLEIEVEKSALIKEFATLSKIHCTAISDSR